MINYTQKLRDQARVTGLPLVTLAIPNLEYQFVISLELVDEIRDFIIDIIKKRNEWIDDDNTKEYLEQCKLRYDRIKEIIDGRTTENN